MPKIHSDSNVDLFTCGRQGGVTSTSDYFSNRDSLRLDDDIFAKQYCGRARVHTDFVPSPYDTESLSLKVNKCENKTDCSVLIVVCRCEFECGCLFVFLCGVPTFIKDHLNGTIDTSGVDLPGTPHLIHHLSDWIMNIHKLYYYSNLTLWL